MSSEFPKMTYDSRTDAAYICLTHIGRGDVKRTMPYTRIPGFNIDFNHAGKIIGIEILDAHKFLPPALLRGHGGG